MRAAIASGDMATAERESHSLKGSAATLGADHLAEAAGLAEAAIRSGSGIDEALRALCFSTAC